MKVLFAPADYQGTAYYRMFLPFSAVKDKFDCTYRTNIRANDQDMKEADLVIIQRQHLDATIKLVKRYKNEKVFLFEIDDNYWAIECEEVAKYWTAERIKGMEELMSECHGILTSTETMVDIVSKFNPNVTLVPNFITGPNKTIKPLKKKPRTIRIGWAGGTAHLVDFTDEIISAIKSIRRIYKGKVQFIFMGYVPPKLVGHVMYYPFVDPFDWINTLHSMGLDIGIIPCKDTPFNKCKSNLKFLEYSHAGIATIASPVDPYIRHIPENTKLLVNKKNTYQSWLNTIQRLIEDIDLRQRLIKNSKEFVDTNYLLKDHKDYFSTLYQSAYQKYRI